MSKEVITLEEILSKDATWEVEVLSLDKKVIVKNPTAQDRLTAQKFAAEHPIWNKLNDVEKETLIQKMVALLMLVNPKITYEQYLMSDNLVIDIILNTIVNEYTIKLATLNEQTKENIRRFLEATMGNDLENIIRSLDSKDMTLNELQESG